VPSLEGVHVYRPADRPDVEVKVDGLWWTGELRGWWDQDGVRLMNVQWRTGPGQVRLDTVPADRVRLDVTPRRPAR
jgi:hypothetical protein